MILRQLAVEIFVIAAIGAVLALLGPFGTYDMPTGLRLLYWLGFMALGYAVYRPIQPVARWLAEATVIPLWAALLIAAALAAIPLTVLIAFAISGMEYDVQRFGPGFPLLYLQVFGIGVGIQMVMRLIFPHGTHDYWASEPEPSALEPLRPLDIKMVPLAGRPDAPFFKRLPQELGDHLVCLEMQDHYVKAHTLKGSTMILMRLKDAITELDGMEGMQIHRSWWVARENVRAVRRDGRNISLELANGLLAPVARNRQEALKREGWL